MNQDAHYRQVARLHAQGIDQGFLTSLGEKFLALLYETIDRSGTAVLITHAEQGQVVGFVAGTREGLGEIYRALLRRPIRLALSLMPVLLSPAKIWRILEILRHGKDAAGQPSAELLSIAVDPHWRGRKVADELYLGLVEHFRAQNTGQFRIVVGYSLAPAHRFYLRMGARPVAETVVHGQDKSIVYVHTV